MLTPRETSAGPTAYSVLADARRVLVIGSPGSGKTTFATCLSAVLTLPVHHLDNLYFTVAWRPRPTPEWHRTVDTLCAAVEWIIDGNHADTLERRLPHADAVIVLNRAPILCLASYMRRLLRYARTPPEALPHYMRRDDGGRALADRPLAFSRFILSFRHRSLPGMAAAFKAHPDIAVVELRTRADMKMLLAELGNSPGRDATC
ncbi:hypothetical protein [Streptomyces sp. NBC_01716]|uniref:hypothetical protein n=1 Tax=Streptomyces sp. NBC_01716 TaxID=2975917 RepID=UPI002E30C324|nr:hypothetical protein [Streptomyces sp. NBC_01716]